jgi:hypothetical protein
MEQQSVADLQRPKNDEHTVLQGLDWIPWHLA